MSGWEKGDLALCVDSTPNQKDPKASLLQKGKIYTVGAAGFREDNVFALAFYSLKSSPKTGWGFSASRFRKVTPPEADEFDREVIKLLNGIPVGEPA